MSPSNAPSIQRLSRRGFFKLSLCGAAGLALYAGEIERHWVEITRHDVHLPGLSPAFDGMRIAQISDIHMDNYTEPFYLRRVVEYVNGLKPDAIFLTGDFVTAGLWTTKQHDYDSAWQCASILNGLECRALYAVLGNHDFAVGAQEISTALSSNGIAVLRNESLPIERVGSRIWVAGVDDPMMGHPDPGQAIPDSIRNLRNEPVILLCHGPDYADHLLVHPAGKSVDLMLSGHTHGGQIRIPFMPPLVLPPMGRKYVEGWFHLDQLQLYVNRGIGAIELPFRFNCPPEITLFTLRTSA